MGLERRRALSCCEHLQGDTPLSLSRSSDFGDTSSRDFDLIVQRVEDAFAILLILSWGATRRHYFFSFQFRFGYPVNDLDVPWPTGTRPGYWTDDGLTGLLDVVGDAWHPCR